MPPNTGGMNHHPCIEGLFAVATEAALRTITTTATVAQMNRMTVSCLFEIGARMRHRDRLSAGEQVGGADEPPRPCAQHVRPVLGKSLGYSTRRRAIDSSARACGD